MLDETPIVEDDEIIEDGDPTPTDNGLKPDDGDQDDIQRFIDAAAAGVPIDEGGGQ
jgi:hypothetical protein